MIFNLEPLFMEIFFSLILSLVLESCMFRIHIMAWIFFFIQQLYTFFKELLFFHRKIFTICQYGYFKELK